MEYHKFPQTLVVNNLYKLEMMLTSDSNHVSLLTNDTTPCSAPLALLLRGLAQHF